MQQGNFNLAQYNDGNLTVSLAPQTSIAGWNLEVKLTHRFGGSSGQLVGSINSGIANGASGLTVLDSGQGVFQVKIPSLVTSGLQVGNYAFSASRISSGSRTQLVAGYLSLDPTIY